MTDTRYETVKSLLDGIDGALALYSDVGPASADVVRELGTSPNNVCAFVGACLLTYADIENDENTEDDEWLLALIEGYKPVVRGADGTDVDDERHDVLVSRLTGDSAIYERIRHMNGDGPAEAPEGVFQGTTRRDALTLIGALAFAEFPFLGSWIAEARSTYGVEVWS